MKIQTITSRDNALVKTTKRLAQSSGSYKEAGQVWLEGEHLCDAFLKAPASKNFQLQKCFVSMSSKPLWMERIETYALKATFDMACEVVMLPDTLFDYISGLPSSGGVGFVLGLPKAAKAIDKTAHTLVLDRVQDAGNVGSMLRSAAAFGVGQVLALQGTALLWSPKVLRAAMGAHFSLNLIEGLTTDDIQLDLPVLATHVHAGELLHVMQHEKRLPHPCAWIMGHEGQGVCQALLDKASVRVKIEQMSEESLNVAAAAAVCLYATATTRTAQPLHAA
jgi:RNA methyltransferase, TrmH family